MVSSRVPRRVQWAVQLLGVAPDDEILEIGCGPGVAISLVCEQLAGGRITAIDRSATAIQRATGRNAHHVASGKAVLRQVELAGLGPTGQRFDKVFAINVNLFWVRPADTELRLIGQLLRPGGALHLIYDPPGQEQADRVTRAVTAALASHGFATTVTTGGPSLLGVTARPRHQH
jgi:SAM-dependent methyltransferase